MNVETNIFKIANNYRPAVKCCGNCKYIFVYGYKDSPNFCKHPQLGGNIACVNLNCVCDLYEYKDYTDEIDENVDEQ